MNRKPQNLTGVIVDAEDADLLHSSWWQVVMFGTHPYVAHSSTRGTRLLHREIGSRLGYSLVDHVNGDGLDNRRSNLREASPRQNAQNQRRKRPGSSQFKGVRRRNGRWQARIVVNGVQTSLGWFDDEREAAAVYDAACILHFGAFAAPGVRF